MPRRGVGRHWALVIGSLLVLAGAAAAVVFLTRNRSIGYLKPCEIARSQFGRGTLLFQ
jgi:hypothetical protein